METPIFSPIDTLSAIATLGGTAVLLVVVFFLGQWLLMKIKPIHSWWTKYQERKYRAIFGQQVDQFKQYVDESIKAIKEENKTKKARIWEEIGNMGAKIERIENDIEDMKHDFALNSLDSEYIMQKFVDKTDTLFGEITELNSRVESLVQFLMGNAKK